MARESESAGRTSDAIKVARVICIAGIVYVHAWLGVSNQQVTQSDVFWSRLTIYLLGEGVGRSSVPLLSIISGWLVASTVGRQSYHSFVRGKAKVILAPMLLWNLAGLAVVALAVQAGALKDLWPKDAWAAANELLFIYQRGAINVQNSFLRDLFICMLAAPALARASDRQLWFASLVCVAWIVSDAQLYILLRPQILTFFILGILIRRHRWELVAGRIPSAAVVLVAFATTGVKLAVAFELLSLSPLIERPSFDLVFRLTMALLYWQIALRLAASRLFPIFARLEPFSFLLFCSHALFLRLAGLALGKVFGTYGSSGFIALFLLQPLFALAAALALGALLAWKLPALAGILSGGRLKRTDGAQEAPPSVPQPAH